MFNTYHRKNVGLLLLQYDGTCKYTHTPKGYNSFGVKLHLFLQCMLRSYLILKTSAMIAVDDKLCEIFPNFRKNKV